MSAFRAMRSLTGLLLLMFAAPTFAVTTVDLGTLYPDPAHPGKFLGDSYAYSVNTYGQVVGNAAYTDGKTRAFLWQPGSAHSTSGTMKLLPTLWPDATHPGKYLGNSHAYGINANGSITGVSDTTNGQQHAFRWTPSGANTTTGTITDLGMMSSGTYSYGCAINSSAQIAGFGNTLSHGLMDAHGFRYASSFSDFMIDNAIANPGTDLPDPTYLCHGMEWEGSYGINDAGVVVSGDLIEIYGVGAIGYGHAFVCTAPTARDAHGQLYDLRGTYSVYGSYASSVNNSVGYHLVGTTDGVPNNTIGPSRTIFDPHAFFHVGLDHLVAPSGAGPGDDLGTLGGKTSYAFGLNDSDQIVGAADTLVYDPEFNRMNSGPRHACYWGGAPGTTGNGIVDLNTLVPNGFVLTLELARGINNPPTGSTTVEIVGWGTTVPVNGQFNYHAFLMSK